MLKFFSLIADEVRRVSWAHWLLAIVLLAAAGVATVFIAERVFLEHQADYAALLQSRLQLQLQSIRLAGRATEPALRIIRPPNAGAILTAGVDQRLPAAWDFGPEGSTSASSYVNVPPMLGGIGWDIETLSRVFGSLLGLGLGLIGALSDRSSGWIRALQALPVSPVTATTARIAGGLLSLASAVLVWWCLMFAGIARIGPDPSVLRRFWLLLPATIVYVWTFFGIGLIWAWRSRTESRAILFGLGTWLGLAILAPALITLSVELAIPVAAQSRMERERHEQYRDNRGSAEDEISNRMSLSLPRGLTPIAADEIAVTLFPKLDSEWQRVTHTARTKAQQFELEWRDAASSQDRAGRILSFLSPGALLRTSLSELAGTGNGEKKAWEGLIAVHQTALTAALFDNPPQANLRVVVAGLPVPMNFKRHEAPRLSDLPVFTPPRRPWFIRFQTISLDIAGMVVWLIGALVGSYRAGVRVLRL